MTTTLENWTQSPLFVASLGLTAAGIGLGNQSMQVAGSVAAAFSPWLDPVLNIAVSLLNDVGLLAKPVNTLVGVLSKTLGAVAGVAGDIEGGVETVTGDISEFVSDIF